MKVDVPWSIGFIVGAAATGLTLNFLGIGGIVRLLLVVGGGVLGGIAGDAIAKRSGSGGG